MGGSVNKKTGASRFFYSRFKNAGEKKPARRPVFLKADITSKQLEPKRLELEQQRQLEPKRLELEQQRQQLVLVLEQLERLQEQLLELVLEQVLLLFSSKQPEQRPAGRRSAGIFSWVFLN